MAEAAEQFDPSAGDPGDFMRRAQQQAKLSGACVLEFVTCSHCSHQFCCSHAFVEVLTCPVCSTRTASRVPRIDRPGETTKDAYVEAIRAMRQAIPEVDEETRKWLDKLEGAVRSTSISYACLFARETLARVETLARSLSGGHST